MSLRFPSFAPRALLVIHIKLPVTNGTAKGGGRLISLFECSLPHVCVLLWACCQGNARAFFLLDRSAKALMWKCSPNAVILSDRNALLIVLPYFFTACGSVVLIDLWHCLNDRTVGVVLLTEESGRGGGDLLKKRRLSNRSFGRLGAVQVTVPSSVASSIVCH